MSAPCHRRQRPLDIDHRGEERRRTQGVSMSAMLCTDPLAAATGPWLVGHVVNLTTLRLGATRAAADHAVSEPPSIERSSSRPKAFSVEPTGSTPTPPSNCFAGTARPPTPRSTISPPTSPTTRRRCTRDRPSPDRRPPPTTAIAATACAGSAGAHAPATGLCALRRSPTMINLRA